MKEYYHLSYNYDKENIECEKSFNSLYYGGLSFNYRDRNNQIRSTRIETIGVYDTEKLIMKDLITGKRVYESKYGYIPYISYNNAIKENDSDIKRLSNVLSRVSDEEILAYIKMMNSLEIYMKRRYNEYQRNLAILNNFENKCLRLRK